MKFHTGKIFKNQNDGKHIFVFGSNLAGRHGKGGALCAKNDWGAEYGVGKGRTGNAYGIPTKDWYLHRIPLDDITKSVEEFKVYVAVNLELTFLVTRVGCRLAGYDDKDIAPLFKDVTDNVFLPPEWKDIFYEPAKPVIDLENL